MKESNIQSLVMMKATELGSRLFRVNVGMAWTGNKVIKQGRDVLIKEARPFKVGVPPGFPDLVGWHPVEITPEMVGKTMCIFVGPEIKTPKGKLREAQVKFHQAAHKAGANVDIVRSPEDYEQMLKDGGLL